MLILLARKAGHCFGVKSAIKTAFETAQRMQQPVYTLGPLIHNPQVVERLQKAGVRSVKNLSEIDEGVIIIRSHGVPPQMIAAAQAKGLVVVDATCPFVKRAQEQAKELVDQGYGLVILGDADHPEVAGIVGTVSGNASVVSGAEEAAVLPLAERYGLISQTTQSTEKLQQVACILLGRTRILKVVNTICNATTDLQEETRRLAGETDVMLVVGGRNSANTTRLAVISREAGVPVHHLETADEIQPDWFDGIERVGVTAGTSTPDWIIEAILKRLKALGGTQPNE